MAQQAASLGIKLGTHPLARNIGDLTARKESRANK